MAQAEVVQNFAHELGLAKTHADAYSTQTFHITGTVTYNQETKVLGLVLRATNGTTTWDFQGTADNVHAHDVPASTTIKGHMRSKGPIVAGDIETFVFLATDQVFHVTLHDKSAGTPAVEWLRDDVACKQHSLRWINTGPVPGLASKHGTGSGTWN